MKLSDFNYKLPTNKIAKFPAVPRDSSKLLVLDKQTGHITDDHFLNLANYLKAGDLLVRNNTKVIPARIYGKKQTGGKVEVLLTKKTSNSDSTETWECLTKPGIKPGQKIFFSPLPSKNKNELVAKCVSQNNKTYTRELEFNQMGPKFVEILEKIGITPLPPYIADTTKDSDYIRKKYQTIYAKFDGSAAAPTAGLHFTKSLEKRLETKGVEIAEVTLHVGLGTFLPVKTNNILEHHMHSEWFEVTRQTADKINKTIASLAILVKISPFCFLIKNPIISPNYNKDTNQDILNLFLLKISQNFKTKLSKCMLLNLTLIISQ